MLISDISVTETITETEIIDPALTETETETMLIYENGNNIKTVIMTSKTYRNGNVCNKNGKNAYDMQLQRN